jgi:RpiR family carbohydrate utilization transcriptional regulator
MKEEQKNKECLVLIKSMLPSMFNVEKKIGEYILCHPDEVINMTVAQLSKEIEVADSSIVRFCQLLNFSGFTQLKINLAKSLAAQKEDIILDDIKTDDDSFAIASKVFTNGVQTLEDTLKIIDRNELDNAVNTLLNAERIEFYGYYTSGLVAMDAYYRLLRIGMPVNAATDAFTSKISASMMNNKCVAVGISHTGRTKDMIETLKIAKSKGATVIGITSFLKSPLIEIADIKLVISSNEQKFLKEAVSSRIAHLALLDSLCACIAIRKKESAIKNLESVTEILNDMRL